MTPPTQANSTFVTNFYAFVITSNSLIFVFVVAHQSTSVYLAKNIAPAVTIATCQIAWAFTATRKRAILAAALGINKLKFVSGLLD
jgi:hypothetical protein